MSVTNDNSNRLRAEAIADRERREPPFARPSAMPAAVMLGRRTSLALAAVVALATVWYVERSEGEAGQTLLVCLALAVLAAAIAMATRRILLAATVAGSTAYGVVWMSQAKQTETGVILHAYDVVTYLTSWREAAILAATHPLTVATALAGLAAMLALTAVVWRVEGTCARRRHAAAALVVLAGMTGIVASAREGRRHTEFYFEDIYLSPFLSSWKETAEAITRGSLFASVDLGPGMPPLALPTTCTPTARAPHIILIHQESVVPPSLFPGLEYDPALDPLFRSHDGQIRKLRVETWGGASWLSEFSVMTGLSSRDFGGLRQMVQPIIGGKVHETLPAALARCGYRNIVFYPMLRVLMSAERFYRSVGIGEMRDAKDQGATSSHERDRFYYENMMGELARHLAGSRAPMFAFVETMIAHGGYGWAFGPEEDVRGGGPGTDPEMHEYLRRLAFTRKDYAWLKGELARRFPGEQFLIVHYGDHQPTATSTLHGMPPGSSVETMLAAGKPAALLTYYAVDGVGYTPPALPEAETVDVPYLGALVLEAARLPLSPTNAERRRLLDACRGRYHDCADRRAIPRFHRRLIDSGIVGRL